MTRENLKTVMQVGACVLVLAILSFFPMRVAQPASAQGAEMPYGGMRFFTLTCTCSANLLLYMLDYATNIPLALVYQPGLSILYSNFNTFTSQYLLGTYMIGAGQCLMYAGITCITLPSTGQMGMMPGTGTSI